MKFWQRTSRPFLDQEPEGQQRDKPAKGILFVRGPHVAELAEEISPEND